MKPYLCYFKLAYMDDGTEIKLTLNKKYPIDCAFLDEGRLTVSIINDNNEVHTFPTEEDWFNKHFSVNGNTDLVLEQI